MRTAIFFGLLAIAFAIDPNWNDKINGSSAYKVVMFIVILMDVWEFGKKISEK